MRPILSYVRRANLFAATGVGALYMYLTETRAEKLKLTLELKIDNAPVPVPLEINNLINEVKNDMKLKKEEKHLIKPFIVQALDMKHLGFSNVNTRSYLGIPHYFLYEDRNDANFLILAEKVIISKNSSEVQALIDSMCLSEGAKKFGIAHELYELVNSQIHLLSALPVLIVTHCNIISYLIEKFSKYPGKSPYDIHVLIFFLGLVAYFLAFNLVTSYKETKSDFLASELGKSYLLGGIEFYDKMMKRNKIIKKLNANAPYTKDGDIRKWIFKPFCVPISRRIAYLRDLGKAKKKKPSVWSYILHLY